MGRMVRAALAAATLAYGAAGVGQAALGAAADEKEGSLYLQCDGQPNNVTAGETAARLIGAVTLLGLFAPPPESYDASKRKFGADGVAACTALLESEKKEGNASRRIGLTLARAAHHIEAKSYEAAIADAHQARQEAVAAGLMADPYYARSQGRAFGLIEGAALFRMGRPTEAREATLQNPQPLNHYVEALIGAPSYAFALPEGSEAEDRVMTWRTRAQAPFAWRQADRLDELGRFADAAKIRDALVDFDRSSLLESRTSLWIAQAALSHALAGDKARAAELAADARANFDARKAEGKPESDAAAFVELMDLYGIVQAADAGDMKAARRLFAARSQWVAASFGSVLETNRRLRAGAAADELIGGLARTPEELWRERAEASKAELIAKDADNKTLFWLIPPATGASSYEALSKNVWRTEKSRLLLKAKRDDKTKMETLFLYAVSPSMALDAYVLHAALLAKSRGQQGFVFMPIVSRDIVAAGILTGDRGAPGLPDALFNDAEEVIADMSPLIPSPAALKARQAAR